MAITDKLKLAAYLDEAGEDPASACSTMVAAGIQYAALRFAWTGNVCDLSDQSCQRLKELLNQHNISTVAIASDLGRVEPRQLMRTPKEKIDRLFNVASYFHAGFVRVSVGLKSKDSAEDVVRDWMQMIMERCLQASMVPLLEVTDDGFLTEPATIAQFLSRFRRWRLLYDPVQLILRHNQDPFSRYWTLLKGFAAAIDLRDFKIGHGFKPPGFGDARVKLTLDDTTKTSYKGWYFLEPSLGRRFGGATTKQETFKMALEALDMLLS